MRNTYIGDYGKEATYDIKSWNMSDEVFLVSYIFIKIKMKTQRPL